MPTLRLGAAVQDVEVAAAPAGASGDAAAADAGAAVSAEGEEGAVRALPLVASFADMFSSSSLPADPHRAHFLVVCGLDELCVTYTYLYPKLWHIRDAYARCTHTRTL